MNVFYLLLFLLAGVCFGLAAAGVTGRRFGPVNFLGLGLVLWVVVDVLRTLQHL